MADGPSRAELAARLAELERYRAEVPPHHGAGDRSAIDQQIDELRSALARLASGP